MSKGRYNSEGAPLHAIKNPELPPGHLNRGNSMCHLPHSVNNPDSEYEYGLKSYQVKGYVDQMSIERATERGWVVVKKDECPELSTSPNQILYGDSQDNLIRRGGLVVMRRHKEATTWFQGVDDQLVAQQRKQVAKYHLWEPTEMEGPYTARGYGCAEGYGTVPTTPQRFMT